MMPINHKHINIIMPFLGHPKGTYLVRNDSDASGPLGKEGNYLVSSDATPPTQAEVDAAARPAIDANNIAMRRIAADNESIARATGQRVFDDSDVAAVLPTADKTDRAAVNAKIDDGTYDTDEKVRGASEWRRSEPSR